MIILLSSLFNLSQTVFAKTVKTLFTISLYILFLEALNTKVFTDLIQFQLPHLMTTIPAFMFFIEIFLNCNHLRIRPPCILDLTKVTLYLPIKVDLLLLIPTSIVPISVQFLMTNVVFTIELMSDLILLQVAIPWSKITLVLHHLLISKYFVQICRSFIAT